MQQERYLINQIKKGDKKAFETLYHDHVGRVYGLCLRLSRNSAQAEDCTQEVFINAWKNMGSFRGEASLSSWLYRIASNVVIGQLRKNKRWSDVEASEAIEEASYTCAVGPGRDLEHALLSLPDQARTVLILYEYLGYKHQEIGELTGIATGTCKAHLHRAKQLMKERLL